MHKTIAVISLWRNNADNIDKSLKQLDDAEKELRDSHSFIYSFFENDSKDNTSNILKIWIQNKNGFLITEVLHTQNWGSIPSKTRTKALASYRNECLRILAKNEVEYDYIFVVDSDILYETSLLKNMLEIIELNPNVGMVTPNTIQNVSDAFNKGIDSSYFDSWALIDKQGNAGLTYASNPFLLAEDRQKWDQGEHVVVKSAFGGAALIRGEIFKCNNLKWNGEKGCEHWFLCDCIRSLNYLVIASPQIIARVNQKKSKPSDSFLIQYDKARLKYIQQNENSSKKNYSNINNLIILKVLSLALKLKRFSVVIILQLINSSCSKRRHEKKFFPKRILYGSVQKGSNHKNIEAIDVPPKEYRLVSIIIKKGQVIKRDFEGPNGEVITLIGKKNA